MDSPFPALTSRVNLRSCGPAIHLAGIAGKNRLLPAIAVRDVRGIDGGRRSYAPGPTTEHANLQGFYGSDGGSIREFTPHDIEIR
jgi:hypothetical protein